MSHDWRVDSCRRGAALALVVGLVGAFSALPASAASQAQYASGWSVKTGPNWTPAPPSTNPLGAPEGFGSSLCTGGINPMPPGGEWVEFTFSGFAGVTDPITGIEVRVKYISAGLDVRLTKSGGLVGSTMSLPFFVPSQVNCDNTAWQSVGGPGVLWGAGLTAADFNANNVGFRLTLTGNTADIDAVELIVYFGNNPPTAEANGPYMVGEGGSVALSSAGSSDPDSDPLTYAWDLDNNGSFETPGASPLFSAAGRDGPDSQTVVLRVTDPGALSDTDTATVTINNVPPTVAAPTVMPSPSDEGESVTASATFTDPAGSADAPYTCTVDYGEGGGPVGGTVAGMTCTGPSHAYGDDGTYTVTVSVTDDDGGSGSNTTSHQVDNVPPTVATPTVSPSPSDEGESVTASATFTDPAGSADAPYDCTVDYGEGDGPEAGTVVGMACTGPPHAYGDNGTYTVTVSVTDDDGGTGSNTTSHQVDNVPPTVAAPTVSPEPSDEGSAVTASATFTDPGTDDSPFTCEVDYGDGSGAQAGTVTGMTCAGPSYTYADNGFYTVVVSVTDKDGGTGSESASHQVDNVAPTITATTNSAEDCGATPEGGLVEVSADFSDPGFDSAVAGTLEDFDASTIDWGDGTVDSATVSETPGSAGTPTTGTVSGSHVYASGGIFTVTVTVEDDDGGSDTATLTALVTGAGLNAGEVQVVGTDFKDEVNIQVKGAGLEVMADFLGPGKAAFPLVDVTSLRVLVCDGNDQVHVNHDVLVPAMLDGGPGRDHLRAGSGLSLLEGSSGNDRLYIGAGGGVLDGGSGNDLLFGGPAGDVLLGGDNNDRLYGRRGDDLLDGGPGNDLCRPNQGADTVVNCEL